MELAEQVIDPEENEAFSYKKETVYDVTNSSGEGIITLPNSSSEIPTSGAEIRSRMESTAPILYGRF